MKDLHKKQIMKYLIVFFLLTNSFWASAQTLLSPDKKTKLIINITDKITYQVSYENKEIVTASQIDMILGNGTQLSKTKGVRKVAMRSNNSIITSPVPEKRKYIPDVYNELKIELRSPFTLTFRAYNDGVAYRISSSINDSIIIINEIARFNFPPSQLLHSEVQGGRTDRYHTSFEETYATKPIDSLTDKNLIFNPAVVIPTSGPKIAINESDVQLAKGSGARQAR